MKRLTPCDYTDAGGGVRTLWKYFPDESADCASPELRPYLAVVGQ
jgi:hypothetical protein